MEKAPPIPTSDERISTQIHRQHESFKKQAKRETGKPPYRVTVRRTIAFVIDCALLAAMGSLLAYLVAPRFGFVDEGYWWVGIALAAIYFSVFDSQFAFGTTLGKRIADIGVQRLDGEPPRMADALLRFTPFAAAFAAYKISALARSHSPPMLIFELVGIVTALAILVFGTLHPMRRGLQDLILNTVVMRRRGICNVPPKSPKTAVIVFVSLAAVVCAAQGLRAWHMTADENERREAFLVSDLQRSTQRIKHIRIDTYRVTIDGSGYKKALKVSAYMDKGFDETAMEKQAKLMASKIASNKYKPEGIALIVVKLKSGFDIGIWQKFITKTYKFPIYVKGARGKVEKGKPSIRYRVMRKKPKG